LSIPKGESNTCIFCRILRGEEEGTFIYRNSKVSALLDIHPLFEGHTLVIPNTHYSDISDVSPESLTEVMRVAQMISNLMIKNLNAEGINIMHSTGRPAGQTIFHFHVHVLPRHTGDDMEFQRWWFSRSHRASREELDALASKLLSK
jgi:histidine triad (HIT) family protein